ncbi:MAG: carboxypeptidase-like regulatory domain-containing protein [Acidimicrobiales bacterium]|nr:carboxypeptidase-like regulatory domain-containing protein [Acidimicrobiales bacterium]
MASALAALVLVAMAACSSDPGALPKVPEFTPASTTTTDLDYSNVPIKGVTGKTPTPSVLVQPGKATLSGTVIGDEGLIAGAKVNVERIVNGQVGQVVLLTLDDGTWSLPMVLGGRYRIRAWRAPDLAQTTATALFLGATETKNIELKVRSIGGTSVVASFAPKVPLTNRDTQLVVRVAEKTVSDEGIVHAVPIEGVRAELIGSSSWLVRSTNPTFTDSSGQADWLLRCRESGRQPLAVTVGTQTVPLAVENCVDPDESTTTTDPGEIITPTTDE